MDTTLISRARELYLNGELTSPDKVLCVCGGHPAEHSGSSNAGACAERDCTRYRANPVALLAARAAEAADRSFHADLAEYDRRTRARSKKKGKGVISVRPSDLGGCRREVYYRETPPEDFVSAPSRKGAAWMGGIIHDEFMRRRRALYPWRLYGDLRGNEVQVPGSERPYRYDEYDPITATLISIKTAGRWRWDLVGQEGADEKWWDQDHVYAAALRELGFPVEWVEVLVIERADGNSENFRQAYDQERADRALTEIMALATTLELGIVPPRDRSGPTTDMLCRNCFARITCWNIPQAEEAGVTPERFTTLGMTPEDEAIEVIGGQLVEAREARLDMEKREAALKAMLDGVEIRPYGEIEPVQGGTTSTAWKEYQAEVERYWNVPESERPPAPPEPPKNRSVSVTWKRLRKATRDRLAKEKKAAEKAAAVLAAEPESLPEAS